MNRYENGKIYKIVDVGFNKCYIGSTCEKLCKRMERHRKDYKDYCEGKKRTYPSSVLMFAEYGIENCKILLETEYPCNSKEELVKKEGEYILKTECVNKNIAGRDKIQYYVDNKEQFLQKAKDYYRNNKEYCDERNKQYYENHKEEIQEYKHKWYEESKEYHNFKTQLYRDTHREEINTQQKQYYQDNKASILQTHKEYNEKNKCHNAKINKAYREKNEEKIKKLTLCGCGGQYQHKSRSTHFKTSLHKNWLKQQEEQLDNETKIISY